MTTSTAIGILIKEDAYFLDKIKEYYVEPVNCNCEPKLSFNYHKLCYFDKKKPTAKQMAEYLTNTVLPDLQQCNTSIIYCTDANYFKTLTKKPKAEPYLGYIVDCKLPGFEQYKIIYSANYKSIFVNDKAELNIQLANKTLIGYLNNTHKELGSDIIEYEHYYSGDLDEIVIALKQLLSKPKLVCDIETFSLSHIQAGLGTISFAWDKHCGIAIDVEHNNSDEKYQRDLINTLRGFFILYKGTLIFHNSTFDIKILIYKLFMRDMLDTEGLLEGLECLTNNFDDTKIIAYLATNTCAGNKLGLKELAHEYVGNYAVDEIADITQVESKRLLKYNLIDCLGTWFVYDKYYPILVQDKQCQVYKLFKSILKNIIQMELTGIPIDIVRANEVDEQVKLIIDENTKLIEQSTLVQGFIQKRKHDLCVEKNEKSKKKVYDISDIKYAFNPASSKELALFLFNYLDFEPIEYTETKQPSVKNKYITIYSQLAKQEEESNVLNAIVKVLEGNKIRNTFIKQFLLAPEGPDGWNYLFGCFNLGGTKSGRLSSSNPNLQNLPAKGEYGKLIKSCISAPKGIVKCKYHLRELDRICDEHGFSYSTKRKLIQIKELEQNGIIKSRQRDTFNCIYGGIFDKVSFLFDIDPGWVFYGIDFESLEDRINALLTKDPNKLNVYLRGFDGHCLRAVNYWKEQFPAVDVNDPAQVNSIRKTEIGEHLRDKSKAPTFLLTYMGTKVGLMKNCGFNSEEASRIESNYHKLYEVSDNWVRSKLKQACYDGYVTLAFGLRLRTPILKKTVLDSKFTPFVAHSEYKTAGNALSGQSYCLLNSRAGIEFQNRTVNSKYKYDIKPCAHIHDAQYGLVRNNVEVIEWLNNNIVECVSWQNMPEIEHDKVKLSGKLELFYPNWSKSITIPNRACEQDIVNKCVNDINSE